MGLIDALLIVVNWVDDLLVGVSGVDGLLVVVNVVDGLLVVAWRVYSEPSSDWLNRYLYSDNSLLDL